MRKARAALIAAVVCAGGSVALLLRAGRHNPSIVLMVLMAIWVLSPYLALALAAVVEKRWGAMKKGSLDRLILLISLGSLALYVDDALRAHREKAAFIFVMAPPSAWLVIVIAVAISIARPKNREQLNS